MSIATGSILDEWFAPIWDIIEAAKKGPVPRDVDVPVDLCIRPTTAAEAVERAREWVGKPSTYRLGGGANALHYPHPFAKDGTCDCSGFTGHVTGHNRIQIIDDERVSFYTDNIVRDAWRFAKNQWTMTGSVSPEGPQHLYLPVTRDMELRPGDLLVRPGRYVAGRRVRIGHVELLEEVVEGIFRRGRKGWTRGLWCIHCTPNRGRKNSVVRSHPSRAFEKASFFCRPKWYVG